MPLVLDGSYGEGGGQILRTSLALAALLGREIEVVNIRQGRKNPGLQPQHLTAVRAIAAITNGQLSGDSLGSQQLVFQPQNPTGGDYEFDVSRVKASAGSVGLIFQAVAPALFFSQQPSRLRLKGGTHVAWSPTATYLERVFLPVMDSMGLRARLKTSPWGWYPSGGGIAEAELSPASAVKPIKLNERGALLRVEGLSVVSNLPLSIAEHQRDQFLRRLRAKGLSAEFEVLPGPSIGQGTFILAVAHYEGAVAGFSALGERGKPAERVADEAFDEFDQHHASGRALDKHLADQLLIYMALAKGVSSFTTCQITQHLLSNCRVIERFVAVKFASEGRVGEPGCVEVEGVGYEI
jgi:RNA 3'-terminal phosphate cyclase (ATP)